MSSPTPSSPQSSPSGRRIRFAPHDEILNPDEPAIIADADDDAPSTPPRTVDPQTNRDYPSPTGSISSSSSSDGPATPSPVPGRRFMDLKSPYSTLANQSDPLELHSSLNMTSAFVWDMARNPQEHLHHFDDEPAAKWAIDKEPLSDFTLTLDGIYEWKIEVTSRGAGHLYPTVKDILWCIYENMSKMAGKDVVDMLHIHTRKRVFAAWTSRCTEFSLNSEVEPLRRVDFLIGARRFLGVSLSHGTQKLVLNFGILPPRT